MRRNAYAAEISAGFQALAENNLGRAIELLNRQAPKPGEEDLRGFERDRGAAAERLAHEQARQAPRRPGWGCGHRLQLSVRPELVEGLSCFVFGSKEGQSFDFAQDER